MLIMIAAIGKNNELGKRNDLIWRLKEDLQNFKKLTTGHDIVMGYNTYLSLPKNLPNRSYHILTTKDILVENGEIHHDIQGILDMAQNKVVYIIGGASIYRQFLPYADKLIITEIDAEDSEADVYFPDFKHLNYVLTDQNNFSQSGINYSINTYLRS